MAIKWIFKRHDDILYVTAEGYDESFSGVTSYIDAIVKEEELKFCRKILCDERHLEYRLSIWNTFKLVKYNRKVMKRPVDIAIVTQKNNYDTGKFWETVSRNRGMRAGIFFDMKKAKTWLNSY